MKTSSIKRLCICVCAALAVSNAEAVYLSTNGTGQVLIYPYYTARNGFATLLSVTNTQNNTKVVKVHFLEGMNGRDVMSFNLFLAPNDTWTAVVADTARGARLLTNDSSCVSPSDLFTETRTISGTTQSINEFNSFSYTVIPDNPAFSTLDRTREGYFEIIEMGVIDATLSNTAAQIIGFVGAQNCTTLDHFDGTFLVPGSIQFPNSGAPLMAPPRGGLRGWASLINAASGANYTFRPTVLDGWSSQVAYSGNIILTHLNAAYPATSMVTTPAGVVFTQWPNGRDAVSAVLMRESVMNDFVLDAGTASQTDWILTFPTKPFYTDPIYSGSSPVSRAPFAGSFSSTGTTGCDGYEPSFLNREGNLTPVILPGTTPPSPPGWGDAQLCMTASVVPFLGSRTGDGSPPLSLLGSVNLSPMSYYHAYLSVIGSLSVPSALTSPTLRSTVGPNGRVTFLFGQRQLSAQSIGITTLISPSGTQTTIPGNYFGLPVIGLMLHNYKNTNVTSRYGGVIEHSYSVRVE